MYKRYPQNVVIASPRRFVIVILYVFYTPRLKKTDLTWQNEKNNFKKNRPLKLDFDVISRETLGRSNAVESLATPNDDRYLSLLQNLLFSSRSASISRR